MRFFLLTLYDLCALYLIVLGITILLHEYNLWNLKMSYMETKFPLVFFSYINLYLFFLSKKMNSLFYKLMVKLKFFLIEKMGDFFHWIHLSFIEIVTGENLHMYFFAISAYSFFYSSSYYVWWLNIRFLILEQFAYLLIFLINTLLDLKDAIMIVEDDEGNEFLSYTLPFFLYRWVIWVLFIYLIITTTLTWLEVFPEEGIGI